MSGKPPSRAPWLGGDLSTAVGAGSETAAAGSDHSHPLPGRQGVRHHAPRICYRAGLRP